MTDARHEPVAIQEFESCLNRIAVADNRYSEPEAVAAYDLCLTSYRALADRLAQVEAEKADMVQRNQILRTRPDLPMTHEDKAKYKELEQRLAECETVKAESELREQALLKSTTTLRDTLEKVERERDELLKQMNQCLD